MSLSPNRGSCAARRFWACSAVGAMLVAVSAVSAASPARAAETMATGTLVIKVTVYPNTTLANATVSIYPSYYMFNLASGATSPVNWGGSGAEVKVTGGKAAATFTIPYNVLVPSSGYKLAVQVQADAQTSQGANYSVDFNGNVAIPANGRTTIFDFNGGL